MVDGDELELTPESADDLEAGADSGEAIAAAGSLRSKPATERPGPPPGPSSPDSGMPSA